MVGKRIGDYLKDKGIKQSFLVTKTGLTASLVSARICKALELPYEYFLDREEE